ncbi:hypothetical protein RGCCGE502_08735 [Rhizobium grahamii CCGE 502]|uniref:Uncharacterized protein n=1 Tax=Rhizobium grahamii CCGE 502 TaxID=990285 RepID=S3HKA3_9HYPH|nr:hypothetical protein RGCCGE502_08735 [Rhizobium grahamii CCGE 502]
MFLLQRGNFQRPVRVKGRIKPRAERIACRFVLRSVERPERRFKATAQSEIMFHPLIAMDEPGIAALCTRMTIAKGLQW